ncbi:MAG: PQQ-binding-like beta-propeller repeat protein [Akkermansiaceae bacterium]
MRLTTTFTLLAISVLLSVTAAAQGQWPSFRGADARGIGSNAGLPTRWSATENVEWKTDLPGRGWSSPIVWNNRVFLTTVVNLGESETPQKGLYFGGERPGFPDTVHQWKVFCLDLDSGKVLWQRQVHEGKPQSSIHLKNSYASETPVTDGEQVYCRFGNLGIFTFDLDGNLKWSKRFAPRKTRLGWGTASSPVLHGKRIYLVNDNHETSWIMALDKATGKEIWKIDRDEKSNWSNPFIWENGKRTEIVTAGTGKVRSYNLDGKELWSLKGMSSITIATPYAPGGLLYVSSGYVGDFTKPLYAIRPGASGDISLKKLKETSSEFIEWCNWKAAPYNPTTLLYGDQVYVLLDRGWMSSLDPKTGEEIYDKKRLPPGPGFTVSPWAYNGMIFCLNEDGATFVCKAGKTFELLGTNRLGDDDMCMACPAMVGDRLLIRTAERLYCIREERKAGKE